MDTAYLGKQQRYPNNSLLQKAGTYPTETQELNSRDLHWTTKQGPRNWNCLGDQKSATDSESSNKGSYWLWVKQQRQQGERFQRAGLFYSPRMEADQRRQRTRKQGDPDLPHVMGGQICHSGTESIKYLQLFQLFFQWKSFCILTQLSWEKRLQKGLKQTNELLIFCHLLIEPTRSLGAEGINMTKT